MEQHRLIGKWLLPDFPQKGWQCIDMQDLGEPSQRCEMCECVSIRYVHVMKHPSYSTTLAVGRVCAEHLEEDEMGPEQREKRFKSLLKRGKTWSRYQLPSPVKENTPLSRETWTECEWKIALNDNQRTDIDSYRITIFPCKGSWKIVIHNFKTKETTYGKRLYLTLDEAKSASFDALLWIKQKNKNPDSEN